MGILLICILLIIICGVIWHYFDDDGYMIIPILAIVLVGFPMAMTLCGDYVSEEEVSRTLIGSLDNVGFSNNSKYISRNREGIITYIKLDKDDKGNVVWTPETLENTEIVIIIQDDEILEPTLTVYESGYKANFWTFSLGHTLKTNVFRLPETDVLPIYEAE